MFSSAPTVALPSPSEQLLLMSDGALSTPAIGFVLNVIRGKQLLPVEHYSFKLKKYQEKWTPCEIESLGTATAVDAVAPWIVEAEKTTIVAVDNKPVSECSN